MRACPQCGTEYPDDVPFCQKDGTQLTDTDTVEEGARPTGTVIGSYRLMNLLGKGGMGFVYLAEHVRLGRKVALKMLRSRYSHNPVAIKRFFREARSVNQINHENIVEITDFVEREGEDNYYIMELLEGESVADILARDGYVALPRALAIITQVCDALSAVHDADIVHRDLKPDNIFLIRRSGREDFVKLLDFGVAKLEDPVEAKDHQTAGGAILGTPEYMSPEQASSKPVDYRTDIYALGVILYEMLTGRQPFTGQSYGELVIKHVTIPPIPPSQLEPPQAIPESLERLIMQCLEKDPEARPRHMQEILVRLGDIKDDLGDLPRTSSRPTGRSRKSYGLLAAGVGLVIVLVAILATVSSLRPEPGRVRSPDAAKNDRSVPAVAKPVVAAPAKVQVTFDSLPPGAEVIRNGGKHPLGITPLSLALDPSPDQQVFEFRLAGYRPVRRSISLEKDRRIVARLSKSGSSHGSEPGKHKPGQQKIKIVKKPKFDQKQPDKKPPEKKPTPEDLGGTLDPFSNE